MRPTIIERGHDKWMTALNLDPVASGNQPQDHIAVALFGPRIARSRSTT